MKVNKNGIGFKPKNVPPECVKGFVSLVIAPLSSPNDKAIASFGAIGSFPGGLFICSKSAAVGTFVFISFGSNDFPFPRGSPPCIAVLTLCGNKSAFSNGDRFI